MRSDASSIDGGQCFFQIGSTRTPPGCSGDRSAAVDDQVLPGHVAGRLGSEIRDCALQVLVAAESADRRSRNHPLLDLAEQALRHLRREEAGTDRVHVDARSEEHTSELQSQFHLVCRLLLEKKKKKKKKTQQHN